MITADEARRMCGAESKRIEIAMAMADAAIREAAGRGERAVIMRQREWCSYPASDEDKEVCLKCREAVAVIGFKVSEYYDEGGQFVDCGTRIEW